MRYQIDFLGWALSEYAANYVPNAPQPVERALRSLIEKLTDLRIWRYRRTMNLIGNFDPNPDPISRDNIMLSAYTLNLVTIRSWSTTRPCAAQRGLDLASPIDLVVVVPQRFDDRFQRFIRELAGGDRPGERGARRRDVDHEHPA